MVSMAAGVLVVTHRLLLLLLLPAEVLLAMHPQHSLVMGPLQASANLLPALMATWWLHRRLLDGLLPLLLLSLLLLRPGCGPALGHRDVSRLRDPTRAACGVSHCENFCRLLGSVRRLEETSAEWVAADLITARHAEHVCCMQKTSAWIWVSFGTDFRTMSSIKRACMGRNSKFWRVARLFV